MHSNKYQAYQLNFASCIPLPQLPVSYAAASDVTISWGKIDWTPPQELDGYRYWHIDGEDVYFYWQFSGKYLLRGGQEIIIDPLPEVSDEHIIGLPILGPLMAMLLDQRKYFVLHASGVKIGAEGCIFLGCKGQGKSTMAATLYARGHKLVADDIAAIALDNQGNFSLLPGFPQIRLWPDSVVAALDHAHPENLPEIYPNIAKRACPTFDNFYSDSLPLKRIYILGNAEQPEIKPLSAQEAVKYLVGNSYLPMTLGNSFIHSGGVAKHFYDCTRIVNQVDVCGLNRPRSLDLLPTVAQVVEEDMTSAYFLSTKI
ncbi:MAG: hypothetical protein AAGF83_20165 [Cyanobacteria bacterium P01_G01_bin.67]